MAAALCQLNVAAATAHAAAYRGGRSTQQSRHMLQAALPHAVLKASSTGSLSKTPVLHTRQQPSGSLAGRLQVLAAAGNGPATGNKSTVIITGASSGLGLNAAKALSDRGDWHIIMACRNFLKAEQAAQRLGIPKEDYTIMHLDLASLESVRQFVDHFRSTGRQLDALVCNAAVYLPNATEPRFTAEGYELSVGVNHLSHFLLANLLLEDLQESKRSPSPRLVIVGSITGNTNTMAGNVPPKADLGDLSGLEAGLSADTAVMIDGGEFNGAKAYKDSKVCNMLTMREMHKRYHSLTGITVASLYPGCIAETGLFREHYAAFRTLFPVFQKYVTQGYVSEADAGKRLAQVVADPDLDQSGVYWSFDNAKGAFVNEVSDEVADDAKGERLWEISEKLVGLAPLTLKKKAKTPAMA